jgi:multiple sugar transport system ATP-binding protein
MGRAIVRQPQVFCMDEPLSNLDPKLRVSTRTQIAALQRRLGVTTVYVTHDQVEAMTMGDRVAVLRDGVLQQCDAPRAMYDRPANVFVAGFIGSLAMNLQEVTLDDGGARYGGAHVPLARDALTAAHAEGRSGVTLGIRPESFHLTDDPAGIPVTVNLVEELGADAYLYGSLTGPDSADGGVSPKARATSSPPPPASAWVADRPCHRDRTRGGPRLVARLTLTT